MLINWAGKWTDSFDHLPYYLVVRLKEVRNQLERQVKLLESGMGSGDKEKAMQEALSQLKKLPVVKEIGNFVRVEEFK
jgi:hypothetical protein